MIVQKRTFRIPELLLQSGRRLRDVEIGYETYGTLAPDKRNVILIAHYFSGNSHAAGRYAESDPEPGYWDAIIGPDKAIDTDRFFVVSADVLSNVNPKLPHVVTTGPASIDPDTGRPYGSSFPIVQIGDFVEVQRLLLDSLGIERLHAVAGPSMGGLQAMEWAARYPERVERVLVAIAGGVVAEPYLISTVETWRTLVELDPDFNGGEYYGQREPERGLKQALKLITLQALHHENLLRLFRAKSGSRWADPDVDPSTTLANGFAVDRALDETARDRARTADANSLIRLVKAVQLYNVRDRIPKMKSRFLFVPVSTDLLMDPAYVRRGVKELEAAGLPVEVFVFDSDGGHLDGLAQIAKASEVIRRFLET